MGIFLVLGMVGIIGAAAREAQVPTGMPVSAARRRRGYVAMTATFVFLALVILLGDRWWKADAASYSGNIYKPLNMQPTLEHGNLLDLKISHGGWLSQRQLDDFIPDHNHLMHLYMIRWPQMDFVFHLHPEPIGTGEFQLALPDLPAGEYHLYADVVHADGFPETLVAETSLPLVSGRALAGDDAEGQANPVENSAALAANRTLHEERFKLSDGYTMVWSMPAAIAPQVPETFSFELLDPTGKPPSDMDLYMGMQGHAAFVKTDGTVFAHIHPTGTVAMAAYMMANPATPSLDSKQMPDMPGMDRTETSLPNSVSFPYGFPNAGRYRIFVQMKHGDKVETGIFDVDVPQAR
ncbi:hypothetical protein [Occallatibacter riparius]|uniref:Secreted protein n=1 Tax=Occallatibacter riparius TaxID=1002689 RepID=A0A9J7BM29_9BACT|nr:hypothetical protein [Occallatibacter riparius]UWZ82826.1 hypothetical protein MOP44_19930 [Occallatibacter riparius]